MGFTLIVETTTVFPNPEISPLGVDYVGLTLQEYIGEKRAMVQVVLRELAPDYLTIENEPTTQRANTGLAFSVADQTAIVNGILSGLDRGDTKIGAGAGSWDDPAYFESLAANTRLDYLDIHFYPIQGDFIIDRAERISEIARSAGKGLAVRPGSTRRPPRSSGVTRPRRRRPASSPATLTASGRPWTRRFSRPW